jgi:hypothetical protein
MQIDRTGNVVKLTLTARELYLLRRALERASLMDTPAAEQDEILSFCTQALEAVGRAT